MATLRVHGVQFLADKKLRVHGVQFTGAGASPTLRVHGVSFVGGAPLSLQPFADVAADAFEEVTITALPGATSPTPTGYLWRQIPVAGVPTVDFDDNGNSITFITPAILPGGVVKFGVTALLGAQSATEVTANVNARPHLPWKLPADGVWVPRQLRQPI